MATFRKNIKPILDVRGDRTMIVMNSYRYAGEIQFNELFSLNVPVTGSLTDEQGNPVTNHNVTVESIDGTQAGLFNGTNAYLDLGTLPAAKTLESGSVLIWAKKADAVDKYYFSLGGDGTTYLLGLLSQPRQTNTKIGNRMLGNGVSTAINFTNDVDYNVWHLHTFVSDGTYHYSFIDATQSPDISTGLNGDWWNDINPANYLFLIGTRKFNGAIANFYNGYIAIVKVITDVLTITEVAAYYNQTKATFGL